MGQHILAHPHQAQGSVRRVVETAEQFLPAWFGRTDDIGRAAVGRVIEIRGGGLRQRIFRGGELAGQDLEEVILFLGLQRSVALQDLFRQGDARRLAAAAQQLVAQLAQPVRRRRLDPGAPQIDDPEPTIGDRSDELTKNRCAGHSSK